MTDGAGVEGLVVVDKPGGMTSHDVVARMRRIAGTRKVGHAGTLDPMATGVLILGIGRATRLLGHVAGSDKEYDATVRLGVRTTTDDAEGDIVATQDTSGVEDAALTAAVASLVGEIEQVPSSVSAVKVDGRRAYARVRAGEEVELAARRVQVTAFDVLARRGDDVDVHVSCSTGTYVRALARDVGEALGVGAHLTALRRTRVGAFDLSSARSLDALAEELVVVPMATAAAAVLPTWPVDDEVATRLRFGQRLAPSGLPRGPVAVLDNAGELVALVEERDGAVRPLTVFSAAAG